MSALDRLYRRVRMLVAPVKITATDDSGPVHRAQVRGFPPETIDHMPVLQIYGLASHALPGSDAMAIFASGDRSNGVIIATGNQKYRLRNLKAGEVALYDNAGSVVQLAAGGNIAITCTGTVTVTADSVTVAAPTIFLRGKGGAAGNLAIIGNVGISGDLSVSRTITADTINAPHGHVGP
jgi:phage baseplate assembly protein V